MPQAGWEPDKYGGDYSNVTNDLPEIAKSFLGDSAADIV